MVMFMNSKQVKYAILLSESGNFSAVAEKLNISQPALSKQILALEKDLGVQLFNRNSSSSILTPAGELFIREARELIFREERLLRSIEQFKGNDMGNIVIGITPFRSSYMMPRLIKDFKERYPHIQVKLREAGSEILRKEAADGRFDFAVVNLPADGALFDITPLESDRLVLVVPKNFSHLINIKKKNVDFADCRDLPFVVATPSQEMRKLFENLCTASDCRPVISAEVTNLVSAWQLALAGVGATMLPLQFVNTFFSDGKVSILELNDTADLRRPAILTLKGQTITEPIKYAIGLLTE